VKESPRSSRATCKLSHSVDKRLNAYVLAASAAGAGLLALTQSAQAKIVYTPANVVMVYGIYDLDLNHDGVTDFNIALEHPDVSATASALFCLGAGTSSSADEILGATIDSARDVKAGFVIGGWAKGRFTGHESFMAEGIWGSGKTYGFSGLWANGGKGVRNRYLALRFKINGKYHFGWARFNVSFPHQSLHAVLTGYAYETIPGKAIVAGQTKGTDDIPEGPDAALIPNSPQPATLGALALGAHGLSIWRREDSAPEHN